MSSGSNQANHGVRRTHAPHNGRETTDPNAATSRPPMAPRTQDTRRSGSSVPGRVNTPPVGHDARNYDQTGRRPANAVSVSLMPPPNPDSGKSGMSVPNRPPPAPVGPPNDNPGRATPTNSAGTAPKSFRPPGNRGTRTSRSSAPGRASEGEPFVRADDTRNSGSSIAGRAAPPPVGTSKTAGYQNPKTTNVGHGSPPSTNPTNARAGTPKPSTAPDFTQDIAGEKLQKIQKKVAEALRRLQPSHFREVSARRLPMGILTAELEVQDKFIKDYANQIQTWLSAMKQQEQKGLKSSFMTPEGFISLLDGMKGACNNLIEIAARLPTIIFRRLQGQGLSGGQRKSMNKWCESFLVLEDTLNERLREVEELTRRVRSGIQGRQGGHRGALSTGLCWLVIAILTWDHTNDPTTLNLELDTMHMTILGAVRRAEQAHGKLMRSPKNQSSFTEISLEVATLWNMEVGITRRIQHMMENICHSKAYYYYDAILLDKLIRLHQDLAELCEWELKIAVEVSKRFNGLERDGGAFERSMETFREGKAFHELSVVVLKQRVSSVRNAYYLPKRDLRAACCQC
ncbi:hypothetical protein QBC40DRAFT_323759 [Triangularia verruculosa]|uniref:Uncharacterized protein n=1 Tax=Triangularia verruculosa TaxID=2587418 RepID=A0AAN6XK22_9PEZI|nr:hypothetical protein QBC40DRAFT_323759 [Triangularia verruculosa]